MHKVNPKHKEFVDNYVKTGNATKAVKDTFTDKPISDGYARVKGHKLLTKDNVQQMIDGAMAGAQQSIIYLSTQAKNETVRLNASKDILDRGGFKPTDKVDLGMDEEAQEAWDKLRKAITVRPSGN